MMLQIRAIYLTVFELVLSPKEKLQYYNVDGSTKPSRAEISDLPCDYDDNQTSWKDDLQMKPPNEGKVNSMRSSRRWGQGICRQERKEKQLAIKHHPISV